MQCSHPQTACINEYEIVRKYTCLSCDAVVMCACEENLARWAWPHQLREGTEYDTHQRVQVTGGFQASICRTCRGLPEQAHPKAPMYGATSKFRRYYWREILFETARRFRDALPGGTSDYATAQASNAELHERLHVEVKEELKQLHEQAPKYTYQEESDASVIETNQLEVLTLRGEYVEVEATAKGVRLRGRHGQSVSVEDWVAAHYEEQGWSVMRMESVPVHALFGTMMWLLVQGSSDPQLQVVGFGERTPRSEGGSGTTIWTPLPPDFGARGYGARRQEAIDAHLSGLPDDQDELLWTFDYWVEPSRSFREYLWAHRSEDVQRGRNLLKILPVETVKGVLRYLVEDYWRHYCGWPDLLLFRGRDFCFAEVKSSNDRLSEDQKRWIRNNSARLHLPFVLVKVLRTG